MMKTMKKILIGLFVTAFLALALLGGYRIYINLTVGDSSPYGVNIIASYSDGKVLIGRRFSYGFNENLLMRLHPDGTVDNSFQIGEGFEGHSEDWDKFINVGALLIQNDEKILVGGYFGGYDGKLVHNIIRLNPDGSIDNTFDVGMGFDGIGNGRVNDIVLQGEKIIIGGDFSTYNGEDVDGIVRLNNDGSIDKSFLGLENTGISGRIQSLVLLPDSSIIAGGYLSDFEDNWNKIGLIKFTSEGKIDPNFTKNGLDGSYGSVSSILLLQDGGLLAGGQFRNYGGVKANGIVRLKSNGSIDRSFNKNGNGFDVRDDNENYISAIELLPDGKIMVGGLFTNYNEGEVGNIIVLDREGNIDDRAKLSHLNERVNDIHLVGENVWIGGDFFKYGYKNAVGLTKIPLKSFE